MRCVDIYIDQIATIGVFEIYPYYLVTFSYNGSIEVKGNVCLGIEQALDLYNQYINEVKLKQLIN